MGITTTNLNPNVDGSTLQWTASPGATHYTGIDEGISAIDSTDYIYSDTFNQVDEFGFESSPSTMGVATGIQVRANMKLVDEDEVCAVKVDYSLDGGSSYTNAGYIIPTTYGTRATDTVSITSLWEGKSAINNLQIKLTFVSETT